MAARGARAAAERKAADASASSGTRDTMRSRRNLCQCRSRERLRELGCDRRPHRRGSSIAGRKERSERYAAIAAELARALTLTSSSRPGAPAIACCRSKRRRSIPIVVIAVAAEPGRQRRPVASLSRPGGNVTGLSLAARPDIAGKRLELLSGGWCPASIAHRDAMVNAGNPAQVMLEMAEVAGCGCGPAGHRRCVVARNPQRAGGYR